jgi:uncharacterized protein YecT (DUF1311 family)
MTMRFVLALAAFVLVAISAADAAAQGRPAYYCDPLHVYSPPYTGNCPVPWRPVAPPVAPQPYGATPPASQGPIQLVPQAARPNFSALGDGLDDWCKTAELPSSIAICSDRELRALVLERQRAYDEAKARLNPDQQKALLADQNGWVRTYPQACGPDNARQLVDQVDKLGALGAGQGGGARRQDPLSRRRRTLSREADVFARDLRLRGMRTRPRRSCRRSQRLVKFQQPLGDEFRRSVVSHVSSNSPRSG